jgi:ammonia channel protein AmtB
MQGDGGFLRRLGYFDRGGSVPIFQTGSLAGVLGAIILGPRYGLFMKKTNEENSGSAAGNAGGPETVRKKLGAILEDLLENTADVDDLFLAKVRTLIKRDGEDLNFYTMIHVPRMILGTFLTVIGFSMLNSCGTGNHSINSFSGRYAAELGLMNTFISGSVCAFICFMLKRHVVLGDHWKTPRYDIRSLCNGFLSGMVAVAAGSGLMKPWGALITGGVQSIVYMSVCLLFKKIKFDDAMENFQTFGTASFTAMLASVFLLPNEGIFWGSMNSGSLLGIQILGWAAVSVWTTVITWIYFFAFKRCRLLKVRKSQEILGLDAIMQAHSKRIDIKSLKKVIAEAYPDHRKKGC